MKAFVIAENVKRYEDFMRENPQFSYEDVKYVYNRAQTCGYHVDMIFVLGLYYNEEFLNQTINCLEPDGIVIRF